MTDHAFLETPRLLVRPWRVTDVAELHAVMSDPLVHQFTSEDVWTVEQTRAMIEWCIERQLGTVPGYFNCPLVLKSTGLLIGRVGLNPFGEYRADATKPEIEWTIGSSHWGRGYATEIGRQMLRYGLDECGFDEIVGFARPDHDASLRVMAKIGMTPVGDREARGQVWRFFSTKAS